MRMFFKLSLVILAGLGAAAPLMAQQGVPTGAIPGQQVPAPAAAPTPATPRPDSDYILGPGDVIEVDVLGQNEFKTRGRILADGTIPLPFLGNVSAQGQSPAAFADRVGAALRGGGYYTSPIVSVQVVNYASRYVTVLGAIGQPGLLPVDRSYRLSEIIARSGGVREGGADYVLLRREKGEELKLDFEKIARGGGADDPMVAPGDKIFIPTAEIFYIYGQVNGPGSYPIKDEMTLRKAIARSGGLTASGSDKRVSVFRGGEKVKLRLNDPVQPGDVIVVGERFF